MKELAKSQLYTLDGNAIDQTLKVDRNGDNQKSPGRPIDLLPDYIALAAGAGDIEEHRCFLGGSRVLAFQEAQKYFPS